ncbi:hypothetical protein LTR53_017183 [Teratosphaeriaceae sp. CCFEE 6253]|nr:hypothetical protein LTR53_017183 [Teratosphaeriaceae sp. CCFEE 6253]
MASLTGGSEPLDRQPEAGKVWQRTRNSTSVVLEIVPGSLNQVPSIVPRSEKEMRDGDLGDGDEVLEVPVYVRVEWEASAEDDEHPVAVPRDRKSDKRVGVAGEKIKKELAFWCVLGVGTIGGGG